MSLAFVTCLCFKVFLVLRTLGKKDGHLRSRLLKKEEKKKIQKKKKKKKVEEEKRRKEEVEEGVISIPVAEDTSDFPLLTFSFTPPSPHTPLCKNQHGNRGESLHVLCPWHF